MNLLNGTAYLAYSGVFDSGDMRDLIEGLEVFPESV